MRQPRHSKKRSTSKHWFAYQMLTLLLFCSSSSFAQGWERTYPITDYENVRTEYMTLTADGGYCLTATVDVPAAQDIAVLKLDAEGNQQWLKYFGGVEEDRSTRIFQLDDGGYIIGGMTFNNSIGSGDYYLLRLDELGNEIWSQNYGSSSYDELNAILPTTDGGFLMMGEFAPNYDKILLIKVDAQGQQEWMKSAGPNVGKTEGRDIKNTADGGYIITGYTRPLGSNDDEDFYLVKLDENGEEVWDFKTGGQFDEFGEDVIQTSDGGYVSAGYKRLNSGSEGDLYLIKISETGDSLWSNLIGVTGSQERAFSITEAPNGDLVTVGNSVLNVSNEGFGLIVRTDSEGNEILTRYLTESNAVGYPAKILNTPDNGFVIAGTGDSIMAVIKTDTEINSFTTNIQGNIFHDIDDDCLFDNMESGLDGWLVIADGTEDYFSIADAQGNYSILCDTGNYILRVIAPNELWETCPTYDEFPLILNDLFDTTILDLPIQSIVDCPNMTVDISAPQLRRCFENTYYIKYCNKGTIDESNALVEVQFDEYLLVNSSSIPSVDLGNNLFSFDVGNVEVGACGTFTVNVLVDCDSTVLGQTHCVEAHIFPDTFCLIPNIVWDSSSIQVSGNCVGDSVIFSFENVGTNPISEPRIVRIIQDDVILFAEPISELFQNQVITRSVFAEGQTFRAEVQQSAGHPGNSMPTSVVEGCGSSNINLGFVTQFPMDDGNYFIDVDCQENIGSYDPNTKAAYPTGYFSEHYIANSDEIEYHIRFQNTGTDTAFTVVLRDTLSPFLDATTIQFGTSSHHYEPEILENGILKFTFENIMLPDSNVNLVGSNGFVKFKIGLKENLSPGTIINNSAGIYFDFNAPIITETVFHTIEIPTEYLVQNEEICRGDSLQGIEIQNDTLLIETIELSHLNSVEMTIVHVLEHSYSDSIIYINSGTEINGEIIENDTTILLLLMAANGCDSLQTVEVKVDNENIENGKSFFEVYPNPVNELFFVEYYLEDKENVNIDFYNSLGQKIGGLVENEMQNVGKHFYKIETKGMNESMIFIHWKAGERSKVQKVIFMKR
ncbi:MAG: T9SS type A sorting domain-containing protein [Saprospiraceae bacterium]